MKGIILAILAGAFITLQGVANSKISSDIGTWQAATITQFTGFLVAFLILLIIKDKNLADVKKVNPIYLTSGAFGAFVIFCNVTAIHLNGVTFSVSTLLIAQLCLTFIIDSKGWFGVKKLNITSTQLIGIGMMMIGVIVLGS
ncbi:DMT family transporter [Gottfriedia sp. NPDC056225]|uniref:DMT family transporter n=1 Tax=Gottfriedia sp. NPDC056225 TaxID=3345751 RepID=UPI001558F84A|nr:DMT family transporter [Arthrobacter citreus]